MPVTIKRGMMKYKNPTTGEYVGVDVAAERTTAEQIALLEQKGQEVLDSLPETYNELATDVGQLETTVASNTGRIAAVESQKFSKPSTNPNGTSGQILRSNGDGTVTWDNAATGEEVASATTAWLNEHISGGQTIAIDDSLSVAGAAADAKKTGDEIGDLKSALNDIVENTPETVIPTFTTESGYVKADGTEVSGGTWKRSGFIDISDALNRIVNIRSTIYGNAGTAWYDENETFIASLTGANAGSYDLESKAQPQTYTLTLPANAKYVRISGYTPEIDESNDLRISYGIASKIPGEFLANLLEQKVDQTELENGLATKVNTNQGVVNAGKFMKVNSSGNVEPQELRSAETVLPEFETEQGLILNTGEKSGSSSWTCSDFVDVRNAINHLVTLRSTVYGTACTAWYSSDKTIIGYVNGNNASEYGITASSSLQTYSLTLPDNAAYVRLSGYLIPQDDGLSVSYQMLLDAPWDEDIELAKSELEAEIADKADKSDIDIISEIVGEPQYINLVNPSLMVESIYIVGATGARAASNYYNSSDFVLLEAGKTYYVGGFYFGTALYHAFYSEPNESSFLSNADVTVTNDSSSHATIVVGTDSVYARFSALKTVSGQYVSTYVDYYVAYAGPITLQEMVTPKCRFKKVLVLGDSISTDNYGGYKKWVTDLIDEGFLPADTVNSSQHASGFVARYNDQPNDFITRLTGIANPETYDLVITFGGINDANKLVPMGTDSDTDYTTYFGAAVRYYYQYLCTNFINARIATLLPLPCSTQNRDSSVIGVQYTYSDYQKSVCEAYSLPVLDLTNHSGFYPDANKPGINYNAAQAFRNRWTLQVGNYNPDGIHPTEEYEKKFLAPMIKAFIETL